MLMMLHAVEWKVLLFLWRFWLSLFVCFYFKVSAILIFFPRMVPIKLYFKQRHEFGQILNLLEEYKTLPPAFTASQHFRLLLHHNMRS